MLRKRQSGNYIKEQVSLFQSHKFIHPSYEQLTQLKDDPFKAANDLKELPHDNKENFDFGQRSTRRSYRISQEINRLWGNSHEAEKERLIKENVDYEEDNIEISLPSEGIPPLVLHS